MTTCSCKCGEERADVQYSRTRLVLTFVTINVIAAALGANQLAYSTGNPSKTWERTSISETETASGGTSTITIDLTKSNGCTDAELITGISKSTCSTLVVAGGGWTAMGVLSILILFAVLILLLRIECRKLCSTSLRLSLLMLITIAWLFILIAWGIVAGSPALSFFDTLGSSFGVMICANLFCTALFVYSVMDYRQAIANGPAPAASYKP